MLDNKKNSILIVDDTPENIDILSAILKSDYDILAAPSGEIALKIAQSLTPPDIILLDVMMPEMDGFEVCRLLKANPKTEKIPVIFVTAMVDKLSVSKGIELGAYYYLAKPFNSSEVSAVVRAALSQFLEYKALQEELQKTDSIMGLMKNGCFQFRTLEETRNLALIISKMAPEPTILVSGLTELMINAVEHGNLGITYEEKSLLSESGGDWYLEVERRLALEENLNKNAIIAIEKDEAEIRFRITDQGSGFDWEPYLDIDVDRADHSHGRGIAMSRLMSFSKVEFQGKGNDVIAVFSLE